MSNEVYLLIKAVERRAAVLAGVPIVRGRLRDGGPIHHPNDGCTDHV